MALTPEEKLKIIKDFEISGVKVKYFASSRNVSDVSLRSWLKSYNERGFAGLFTKYDK